MSRFIELHLNEKGQSSGDCDTDRIIYVGLTAFVEGDSLFFSCISSSA